MQTDTFISYGLSLTESSGPLGRVGSPKLFCWLSATHLPGSPFDEGKALVISLDQATGLWREYSRKVSLEQSRDVIERLRMAGVPDRTPAVHGVSDTSDGWSHILFQARVGQRRALLDLSMFSSGFEGPEAEQLRALFRYIFHLAGYDRYTPSIYGTA